MITQGHNTSDGAAPRSRLPRRLRRAAVVGMTVGTLVAAGVGQAHADTTGTDLTEEWGTATVSAEPYFLGGARISATITDTRSDSRCVYVDYKINAPRWYDGFDKLTRVCGNGDTDENTVEWVGPSWTGAESVEFRICREQGFGSDPCGPVVTVDL